MKIDKYFTQLLKQGVFLSLLFLFLNCYSQTEQSQTTPNDLNIILRNNKWQTDLIFGLDSTKEKYILTKRDTTRMKWAGNYLEFKDNVVFNSGYSA